MSILPFYQSLHTLVDLQKLCVFSPKTQEEWNEVHTFQDFAQALFIYDRAFVSEMFCIYHSVY